jgi:5-methylcytosine-specific restriction endonuclease McrA
MANKITPSCSVPGCTNKHKAKGFCRLHWERFNRTGSTDAPIKKGCSVDGCESKHFGIGFCLKHWKRFKKHGNTDGPQPRPCINCGESFTPPNKQPHAKSCSQKCRNDLEYAKRKSAEPSKACKGCGALFNPLLPKTVFCSRECGAAHTVIVRTKEKACTDCGKSFSTNARHSTCPDCSYQRMLTRVHARNKIRRYLRRGADGPTHTAKDWISLLARFRGMCAYCGIKKAAHKDHVIPISRGGRDSIGNILPACSPCNLTKGGRLITEWKHGKKYARKKAKTNTVAHSRR